MGLLENVKRAFNIGGATITIVTDDEVHAQGGPVTGQIHIQGGDRALAGRSITLALREFWTETTVDNNGTKVKTVYKTWDSTTLAYDFSIPPQTETSYPFDFQLSSNCRLSASGTGWQLQVKLDVPNALNPGNSVTLQVDPAEVFMEILQACVTELGFQETKRSWTEKTATTHFRLNPPETLTAEFDYIRLELSETDDGSVIGYLVGDLQEKTFGDYFKAMLNRDKVKIPILRTRDDLFAPDGTPRRKATALFIGEHLQAAIRQRNEAR